MLEKAFVGQVVHSKKRDRDMTVISYGPSLVTCLYFDRDQHLRVETFSDSELTQVPDQRPSIRGFQDGDRAFLKSDPGVEIFVKNGHPFKITGSWTSTDGQVHASSFDKRVLEAVPKSE